MHNKSRNWCVGYPSKTIESTCNNQLEPSPTRLYAPSTPGRKHAHSTKKHTLLHSLRSSSPSEMRESHALQLTVPFHSPPSSLFTKPAWYLVCTANTRIFSSPIQSTFAPFCHTRILLSANSFSPTHAVVKSSSHLCVYWCSFVVSALPISS
jgi:hypothetical protein